MLDGVFAFVLYDTRDRTYVAARDAIGVNPLYIGWGSDGRRSRVPAGPSLSILELASTNARVHVSADKRTNACAADQIKTI
jgi:hypothetical protein